MDKILLLCGGDSFENEISILTMKKVEQEFIKNNWDYLVVYLNHQGEFFLCNKKTSLTDFINIRKRSKGSFISRNNKYCFKVGRKRHYFDFVLPLLHGKNAEDGLVGAYFDTIKIPCIYSGIYNASLLQDKYLFKNMLKAFNIKQTKFTNLSYYQYHDTSFDLNSFLSKIKFPTIAKPSKLGSSIGIRKIDSKEQLKEELDVLFKYDDRIIFEEEVKNLKEVNIALLGYQNQIVFSESETVNDKNEILSFYDKYQRCETLKESRIIPSDINEELLDKIKKISFNLFEKLDCFGIVRFDFLIDTKKEEIYLNEINTIPGALAYYLFEAKEIEFRRLLISLVNIGKQKIKHDQEFINKEEQLDLEELNLDKK